MQAANAVHVCATFTASHALLALLLRVPTACHHATCNRRAAQIASAGVTSADAGDADDCVSTDGGVAVDEFGLPCLAPRSGALTGLQHGSRFGFNTPGVALEVMEARHRGLQHNVSRSSRTVVAVDSCFLEGPLARVVRFVSSPDDPVTHVLVCSGVGFACVLRGIETEVRWLAVWMV